MCLTTDATHKSPSGSQDAVRNEQRQHRKPPRRRPIAQPVGTTNTNPITNAAIVFIVFIGPALLLVVGTLLGLLLQDSIETVEERRPSGEQVVVVRHGLHETIDREVDAGGFVPRELAVVQIRLVHDLGNHPHTAILDAEPLHKRFERAVVAVMAELRTEHVERRPFARGIRGICEFETSRLDRETA